MIISPKFWRKNNFSQKQKTKSAIGLLEDLGMLLVCRDHESAGSTRKNEGGDRFFVNQAHAENRSFLMIFHGIFGRF